MIIRIIIAVAFIITGGIIAWFSRRPSTDSPLEKFGNISAILAILLGLLVYVVPIDTSPTPSATNTPSATSTPSATNIPSANDTSFNYSVSVKNLSGQPVRNAEVILTIDRNALAPLTRTTDVNGFARFQLDAKHENGTGRITIHVNEYELYEKDVDFSLRTSEARLSPISDSSNNEENSNIENPARVDISPSQLVTGSASISVTISCYAVQGC